MNTNESEWIASQLDSLCSTVIEITSSNEAFSPSLLDIAQSFCALVTTAAKAALPMTISGILCALRLGTLLLSALNKSQNTYGASELEKSVEEWTCGGIICIASLLPPRTVYPTDIHHRMSGHFSLGNDAHPRQKHPEEKKEKKESEQQQQLLDALLAVVHSLLCFCCCCSDAQEHESQVVPKEYESDNPIAARRSISCDVRLRCATELIKHGLSYSTAAEQFLSSDTSGGQTLQRFLLRTLQNEYAEMRRVVASGVTIPSTVVSPKNDKEETPLFLSHSRGIVSSLSSFCLLSSNPMCYYAPLVSSTSENTRGTHWHVPSGSNISVMASHSAAPLSITPRPHQITFLPNDTPRPCGSYASQRMYPHPHMRCGSESGTSEMVRLECVGSAALQWAFAVITALTPNESGDNDWNSSPDGSNGNFVSLATAEVQPKSVVNSVWFNETSDFVDFIGDLVCVCAVVVRPFLDEQLQWIRHMQRTGYEPTTTKTTVTKTKTTVMTSLQLVEDAGQFVFCIDVIARFLERHDKGTVPLPVASPAPLLRADTNTMARTNVETISSTERIQHESHDILHVHNDHHTNDNNESNHMNNRKNSDSDSYKICYAAKPHMSVSPMQSAPIPPPLAAFLASTANPPISSSIAGGEEEKQKQKKEDLLPWKEVVALFTEVKCYREAEQAELYKEWMELRQHNVELAQRVLCMQSRRDALRDVLPHGVPNTPEAMNLWTAHLKKRVAELEEELGISKTNA